jgi:hypothetical protein
MQPEPKMGPKDRICLIPVHGRIRPEEVMRRKLIQKMEARRERRLAIAPTVRRAI